MRSIFIVLVMVFTNTLDFQKSLITAIPGVINFEVHLIIELFFRVEHKNEHLLIGRRGTKECEGKIVSKKPSDSEYLLRLFLLLCLILVALLGKCYYRAWDSNVEDYQEHQSWRNSRIH